MLLHLKTWPDVEAYLKTNVGIVIPIGSTEQHGPNGLVGTDAICAEAVARGVGEVAGRRHRRIERHRPRGLRIDMPGHRDFRGRGVAALGIAVELLRQLLHRRGLPPIA